MSNHEPGDIIADRFEIDRAAGSGGMGSVFRARDHETGEFVALKVMRTDEGDVERFEREAMLLAGVSSDRIVRYVAHGITGDRWSYLAMEWLMGEDLASRLRRGPLPLGEALDVARGAAEALAAAHALDLLHRDVKPSNLFLVGGDVGQVKLIDFGIARLAHETMKLTMTGQTLGTPSYMAPEQARGDRTLDPSADVFSLGCVLFECLAGRPAFAGSHAIAVLAKILIEEAPRLADHCAAAPPQLSDLVARMLAKSPSERPRDGAALLAEIARIEGGHTRTAPPPRREVLGGEEQRMLCVVLSRPDTGASVIDERLEVAVTSRGGQLEQLANGSVLALVAGPGAPMDLAARAARCALAMATSLPGTPIALVTGLGVVAGRLPVGAVIDDAAKLLTSIPIGEGSGVWTDEATAGLVEQRFDVAREGEALRVTHERSSPDAPRTLLGKPTSCVGRERELASLEATFDECRSEGVAHVTLVTAPAGTGKSRLLNELFRVLRAREVVSRLGAEGAEVIPATVLVARGDATRAGSPYAIVADALARASSLVEGEPAEAQRAKLAARLGKVLSGEELIRATDMLGAIMGLAPGASAHTDPTAVREGVAVAFEDWISAEVAAAPVLFVIEDLHYGDLPSIKLLDAALRVLERAPLMALATARPEVHDTFPALFQNRSLEEIRLGPVSPRASERLVREVLGGAADAETTRFITQRAAGHPFLLEELIRAFAKGSDAASAGRSIAAGEGHDALSGSVLGMVQVRLDGLDAGLRRTLRAASVFGERFWPAGIVALTNDGPAVVRARLDTLATKEITEPRRTSSVPGETEHAFRHALVRDAVYATLTDADRALGHRLAGAWLEDVGGFDEGALADHFDRGGDADRAIAWHLAAGDKALDASDFARAARFAERALALGPGEGTRGELEGLLAEVAYYGGDLARGQEIATRAAGRLDEGGVAWFRAVSVLIRASGQRGDNDVVEAWTVRAARVPAEDATVAQIVCLARGVSQLLWAHRRGAVDEILKSLLDRAGEIATLPPGASAWAHRAFAEKALLRDNRIDVANGRFLDAALAFDRAGAPRDACLMWLFHGIGLSIMGDGAAGEAIARREIERAERVGARFLVITGLVNWGTALLFQGRAADAERVLLRALEGARGSARTESGVRTFLALARVDAGDFGAAVEHAQIAAAMPTSPTVRAGALGVLARALAASGRAEDALAHGRSAVELVAASQDFDVTNGYAELGLAEALLALGDRAGAREAIGRGLARIEAIAASIEDPDRRRAYLARPHANDRIVALARALGEGAA